MRFDLSDDPPESIVDALRRAGWSLGDARSGDNWTVSGTNGENVILALGNTIEEALADLTAAGELVNRKDRCGYRLPEWPKGPQYRSLFD